MKLFTEPTDIPREQKSSWNTATLEDIKDILYELHEYFEEFEIEVVACPTITLKSNNVINGISKYSYIMEKYDPLIVQKTETNPNLQTGLTTIIPLKTGRNYFCCDQKPGMVLKMRAKGRKTNYNIATLIQNILHKRFSHKMGLGGLLLIKRGNVVMGYFNNSSEFKINEYINYSSETEIPNGPIVNDPVIIIGQYNGLFYTSERYMLCSNLDDEDKFLNDFTPEETEYIGYFNIANEVRHL